MSSSERSRFQCVGGFAPGNYFSRCYKCGEQFEGDKRAFQCRPCALLRYEVITSAAICHKGVPYFLPPPARHHDVARHILENVDPDAPLPIGLPHHQGFMTSRNRFVGRAGAYQMAVDAGQLERGSTNTPGELFSEDLW